jgi:hypothetical protein
LRGDMEGGEAGLGMGVGRSRACPAYCAQWWGLAAGRCAQVLSHYLEGIWTYYVPAGASPIPAPAPPRPANHPRSFFPLPRELSARMTVPLQLRRRGLNIPRWGGGVLLRRSPGGAGPISESCVAVLGAGVALAAGAGPLRITAQAY